MKNFFLLFVLFVCISSCKTGGEEVPADPYDKPHYTSTTPKLSLICEAEKSMIESVPAHTVYLQFNEERIKLAKIQSCETFKKEDYEQYQMPKNAMDAVGGWWAGSGEYFYLLEKPNGSYVVNYGQMYEEKETGNYDYTEMIQIKKNTKGNYAPYPKHQLHDLVGVYTLGGHDQSWMLVIRPDTTSLAATYYVIDGMLPPAENLKTETSPMGNGKILKDFNVDFSDKIIETELGQAQVENIFQRERITFFEIPSHQEEVLRLTKDPAYDFLLK